MGNGNGCRQVPSSYRKTIGGYVMSIWTDFQDLEFKNYFLDANGIKTRVLEAGVGEPLILLHGTGGHIEAYARNIKG